MFFDIPLLGFIFICLLRLAFLFFVCFLFISLKKKQDSFCSLCNYYGVLSMNQEYCFLNQKVAMILYIPYLFEPFSILIIYNDFFNIHRNTYY